MGQLFTPAGYLFGEATSAMQKSVRRGWTDQALYWSFELATRYDKYVWRRLNVIVNEDVGIGVPNVITRYWELSGSRSKRDLAEAVRLLCACRKTRLADFFLAVAWEREFRWRPTITGEPPALADGMRDALLARDEETALDYALSLDSVDDGLLWRTLKLASQAIEPEYPFAATAVPVLKAGCAAQIAGKKRGWESYLFFAQAILILCRQPVVGPLPVVDTSGHLHQADGREIPDPALDMHTGRGRKMGRGVEAFFAEGMIVIPEAEEYVGIYLDRFKAVCRAYEAAGGKVDKVPPRDGVVAPVIAVTPTIQQLSLF